MNWTRPRVIIPSGILCVLVINKARQHQNKPPPIVYKRVVTHADSSSDKVTVLVTGGCGSFGKSLVKSLVEDGGYNVHCLDVYIPNSEQRLPGVSSFISTDVTNKDDFELALKETKPEAVFHTAAILPRIDKTLSEIRKVNHDGTNIVVNGCKRMGVSRLIHTSSYSVILDKNILIDHNVCEDYPLPEGTLDAYTGSKKSGEKLVLEANGKGMVTCSLRSATICNTDSPILKSLLEKKSLCFNNGVARLPIIDTDGLIRAHLLAEKKLRSGISSCASGQTYNIAVGSPTIHDLYNYSPDPDSTLTLYGHPKPKSVPLVAGQMLVWINVALYHLTGYTLSLFLVPSSMHYYKCSVILNTDKVVKDLGLRHETWQKTIEKQVKEYREKHGKKMN